jgi:hypothetical protein
MTTNDPAQFVVIASAAPALPDPLGGLPSGELPSPAETIALGEARYRATSRATPTAICCGSAIPGL